MTFYNNTELVTVVIANHNRCDDLRAAIRSVKEQEYPNIEIVIVDNASRDNSCAMLASEFPDVCVIALNENRGMDGYSAGFEYAKGEYIFQMDNDSVMADPRVLSEVVARFQAGPEDLAVVATRVEEYDGKEAIGLLKLRNRPCGPINMGGFHSGGVGFRRRFLDQVGYYNRDVFLYGSELFLQMKFLAAGLRVFYYPEILMLHKSSRVARSSNGLYYDLRNRYWFMRHFATCRQRLRFLPMMILHDAVYSICTKTPRTFVQSVKDGFGSLPPSIRRPLRSKNRDFVKKVDEVGFHFCFTNLKNRLINRVR